MGKTGVVQRMVWSVVLVLVFSLTLSASSLSGRMKTQLILNTDKTIDFSESIHLWSGLATEVSLDGWTFANATSFGSNLERLFIPGLNGEGLNEMKFEAAGFLGAFEVISSMTFTESSNADFRSFAAARMFIGGLSIWSGATL